MEYNTQHGPLLPRIHQSCHRYHAIYTVNTTYTKDVLIVGCSTDNFLCDYSRIQLYNEFLAVPKKYFPVTSKEGPHLSYLNLRIIQSQYGISIDNKYHTQDTILTKLFPYAYDKVNSAPNLLKNI